MRFVNDPSMMNNDKPMCSRYGKTGDEIASEKEKVYAQIVHAPSEDGYFLRGYQGAPYDPFGTHSDRERFVETGMRKVSKKTFDFYMVYLKTKNSIYLTKASRGMLNG